jgi:hypothetical protein
MIANPWTKKNPFLSMFLSGANATAGRARGLSLQQARRIQSGAMKAAMKQATGGWSDLLTSGSRKRKRPK